MADGTVREFPFEIVGQSPMAEAVQKAFTEKDIEAQIVECRPVIDRVFKGLLRVADKQLEVIQEKTND